MLHKLSLLAAMTVTLADVVHPTSVAAQTGTGGSRTLDSIARIALARNLSVRRAVERQQEAEDGVREARGRLLPTLSFEARYTESNGAINLGDLINPAYRALNTLTASNSFPTNVSATLPLRQGIQDPQRDAAVQRCALGEPGGRSRGARSPGAESRGDPEA